MAYIAFFLDNVCCFLSVSLEGLHSSEASFGLASEGIATVIVTDICLSGSGMMKVRS